MTEEKPVLRVATDPLWARWLFGNDPWPMLLVIVACGFLLYLLTQDALPAIVGVLLIGLLAHAWLMRREHREIPDGEEPR